SLLSLFSSPRFATASTGSFTFASTTTSSVFTTTITEILLSPAIANSCRANAPPILFQCHNVSRESVWAKGAAGAAASGTGARAALAGETRCFIPSCSNASVRVWRRESNHNRTRGSQQLLDNALKDNQLRKRRWLL